MLATETTRTPSSSDEVTSNKTNKARQTQGTCIVGTLTFILRVPDVRKHETGSVSAVTHLGDTDERVGHFGSFHTRSYASVQELKQKAVSLAYMYIYIGEYLKI